MSVTFDTFFSKINNVKSVVWRKISKNKIVFRTLLLNLIAVLYFILTFACCMKADQLVQWSGKPAAVPEVPGSNPG